MSLRTWLIMKFRSISTPFIHFDDLIPKAAISHAAGISQILFSQAFKQFVAFMGMRIQYDSLYWNGFGIALASRQLIQVSKTSLRQINYRMFGILSEGYSRGTFNYSIPNFAKSIQTSILAEESIELNPDDIENISIRIVLEIGRTNNHP